MRQGSPGMHRVGGKTRGERKPPAGADGPVRMRYFFSEADSLREEFTTRWVSAYG